jgi:2,3-bisphosphoglycerate-independent phosphoglycerate mutase
MHPGSEIANLAVLGYDVEKVFEGVVFSKPPAWEWPCSRAIWPCVATSFVLLTKKLKTIRRHISSEEASELIHFLNEKLGTDTIRFFPGVSYRHLLVLQNGQKEMKCTPPHDVPGTPFRDVMIRATSGKARSTVDLLNQLIGESQKLFENHPVNIKRKSEGKDPANSIWPWSPGYKPQMPALSEMFGIQKSAVISAVDLIQGIGVYAGMNVIQVEGATGLYNTNYEGKAKAAVDALKENDLVYLHIEASDEAGHEGDVELKTKTINTSMSGW